MEEISKPIDITIDLSEWYFCLLNDCSCTVLISGALCNRFGCRPVVIFGGAVVAMASFAASFSQEMWHLYLALGVAGRHQYFLNL